MISFPLFSSFYGPIFFLERAVQFEDNTTWREESTTAADGGVA